MVNFFRIRPEYTDKKIGEMTIVRYYWDGIKLWGIVESKKEHTLRLI